MEIKRRASRNTRVSSLPGRMLNSRPVLIRTHKRNQYLAGTYFVRVYIRIKPNGDVLISNATNASNRPVLPFNERPAGVSISIPNRKFVHNVCIITCATSHSHAFGNFRREPISPLALGRVQTIANF